MKFKSDIEVQAGLRDSSGAIGSAAQILSSTGTNVSWINQSTVASDVQNEVKAGVAINKGQAVYVTGADGTNIIVGLASNASEATSSKTLGLLDATVAINGFANVVQIGRLSGLNTLGATAGDPVWLGTGGNLIYGLIGKPYAPANLVFIGVVTRVNVSNGEIFVNVQNGFELNEIHDVDLKTTVPINGDILGYNGTLWVNKTIAGWLGYTPANASGTVNYVSKFTGTTTLGNSQIFDNGSTVGINNPSASGARLYVMGTGQVVKVDSLSTSVYQTFSSTSGDAGYIGNGWGIISGTGFTDLALKSVGNLLFATNNGTEKMRITSAGDVGIGTASPSQRLHVSGSARITGAIYDSSNSAGTSGQVLSSTATGTAWVTGGGGGGISGSGTTNTLPKFTGSTAIGDSNVSDSGSLVTIATDTLINGITVGRGGGNISTNIAIGVDALANGSTGGRNVTIGVNAGKDITSGEQNTFIGYNSRYNTEGNAFNGSNTVSIVKNSSNSTGLPHFWAPDTIVINDGGSTNIIILDITVYSGFFLDYTFQEDSANNLMQSGTVRAIFLQDGSSVAWSNDNVLSIGNTANVQVGVFTNTAKAWVQIDNNLGNSKPINVNFTARLILRQPLT
jgi:hypothetical protein